jgi:hypothetical protein
LAEKFCPEIDKGKLLSTHAVCLCDDDNDLEMAMACEHAYVPEVSSSSMLEVIRLHPDHFTQTCGEGEGHQGTVASETALSLVLGRLSDEEEEEHQEEALLVAVEEDQKESYTQE